MQTYRFANLVFTVEDGRLRNERSDAEVGLRPQAARLLEHLVERAGEVVPRENLFRAIWGDEAVVDFESGLAALLRELRQSIRSVDGPEDLIETVPRRGYRLEAQVRRGDGSRAVRRRAGLMIAGPALLVLAAVFFASWQWFAAPAPDRAGDLSLAILPFEIYDSVEDWPEHANLLLADTLLAELLARPAEGLVLIGRTSLRPYVGREDVVSAVAENLGVELLVEGAVTSRGEDGWRAEVRLLSVPRGRVLWSTTIQGEAGRPAEVPRVAEAMASELVGAWPQVRSRLAESAAGD